MALLLPTLLHRYWYRHGGRDELEGWFVAAFALPDAARPTPARARALWVFGFLHYFRGSVVAARALIEESLALARQFDDKRSLARALWGYGVVLEDATAALDLARQGEALARAVGDRWELAYALIHVAIIERRCLDSTDRARARLEEAERLYREIGEQRELAYALTLLAQLDNLEGRQDAARARFEETVALSRARGLTAYASIALGNLGWWHALHPEADASLAGTLFAEGLRLARDLGRDDLILSQISGIATAALRLGCSAEAVRLCAAAEATCQRRPGLRLLLPAELSASVRGRTEAARAALGEETFAAAWAEGEALSQEEAIAQALALAEELAAAPATSHHEDKAASADVLTARETEVLRLIAAGKTNAEIAGDLVLSVRTVERHISTIYGKLGISGKAARAIATAYALTHRPVGA
jgi:DNA-binding NarL/FixJ family response regulator